ncbi:MAG: NACHT domain-containing protein [Lewinellaceae bacterium]|nr:NACHT domain-containing protein [Lewinellaceae bacterium]
MPLLSLYVRANILEKISARAGAKVEDLESFFDFDRRAFGEKKETKDGEAIANDLQRFIVLGKPGAGKTTFLKYLALAMVHQQSDIQRRRLPIFITLRDWADKRSELMDYITEQFDICGSSSPDCSLKICSGKATAWYCSTDSMKSARKPISTALSAIFVISPISTPIINLS